MDKSTSNIWRKGLTVSTDFKDHHVLIQMAWIRATSNFGPDLRSKLSVPYNSDDYLLSKNPGHHHHIENNALFITGMTRHGFL